MHAKKILVIDDSPIVLDFMSMTLGAAGFEVLTRDNPFGSTAAIFREKPDVVLIDMEMPGLSGSDLIEQVRKHAGSYRPRILLFSSLPAIVLQAASERCHADGYVSKDMTTEALVQRIQAVIQATDERAKDSYVLFVEDNQLTRRGYERAFSHLNARYVDTAAEALALINGSNPPCGVVSDVMMPAMSGHELYRAAVATDPSWEKRFVFVTAARANPALAKSLDETRAPVFDKPINVPHLEKFLGSWLVSKGEKRESDGFRDRA